MKAIFLIPALALFFSCGNTPQQQKSDIPADSISNVSVKEDTVKSSAYYDALKKYFPLTKPVVKADSIIAFHNPSNTFSKIYLPVVDKQYKAQVYALAKTLINTELNKFRAFVLKDVEKMYLDAGDTSLFEAWPIKVYCTNDFTGIVYLTRELPYAGVHSNYFYKTLNIQNGKPISSADFFAIKSHADTLAFAAVLDKHLKQIKCKKGRLNSEMNFLIRNDSIDFFFSSYEAGAFSDGAPEVTVGRTELKNFIR